MGYLKLRHMLTTQTTILLLCYSATLLLCYFPKDLILNACISKHYLPRLVGALLLYDELQDQPLFEPVEVDRTGWLNVWVTALPTDLASDPAFLLAKPVAV